METPAESQKLIAEARRHANPALVVIGIFKLFKTVLLICAGFAALYFVHSDIGEFVMDFAMKLHIQPANEHLHHLIASLEIGHTKMEIIAAATFTYAVLYGIEGIGLLMDRTWAEWMTVITTAGFIPLEAYEIYDKTTFLRIALLAVNLIILAYLAYRVSIKVKAYAEKKRLREQAGKNEKPASPGAG